jgi:hypothetical protein
MGQPAFDFVFPAADSIAARQAAVVPDPSGIISKINATEASNIQDALNGAGDKSANALTYGMYLSRNKTVSDIASTLTKQNYLVKNGPSDTYTRQGEINEWQAQNKLDTLFFLQTLFIYLTAFVVLLFLRRYDLLPSPAFYLLSGVLTVAVVGILWNRAYYTAFSRDKRYWNRRFIGLDSAIRLPTHHEMTIQYNDPGNAVGYTPLGAKQVKEGGIGSTYYNYIFNSPQYVNTDVSGNPILGPGQTVLRKPDTSVTDPRTGNTVDVTSSLQGDAPNNLTGIGEFTSSFN